MHKSESTKSVEWDLTKGDENEAFREHGIMLEDASLGGPRKLTIGDLLTEQIKEEPPIINSNSISINVDCTTDDLTYSTGTQTPTSPLRSPKRVCIDTDFEHPQISITRTPSNSNISNNTTKSSFAAKRNKSVRTIDTTFNTNSNNNNNNDSFSPNISRNPSPNSSYYSSSFPSSPLTPVTPRAINPYIGNITNYYDIAIPSPSSTPASSPLPSSSPASSGSPPFPSTPFSEKPAPFGSRHNSEGHLKAATTTKLFKNVFLEFVDKDLENEYLTEVRVVLITQQKIVALLVAFCLLIDSLLKGLVFLDGSTFKGSLGPPILFVLLYAALCIGKVSRRSQEVVTLFSIVIIVFCQLESKYHTPLDLLATRSTFVFLILFAVFRVKFKYSILVAVSAVVSVIIMNVIWYKPNFPLAIVIPSPLMTISIAIVGCFVGYQIEKKEREVLAQRYIMQIETKKLATHSKRDQALLLSIFPRALLSEIEKHHFRTKYLSQDVMHQSQHGFNQLAHFYHSYLDVSILIADVVGFTALSSKQSPREVVTTLNLVFEAFDELTFKFGLEKIRTIGDAYLCVGNMTSRLEQHEGKTVSLAWEMVQFVLRLRERGYLLNLRIGIDCGPVYAGVTGLSKWNYDIFGSTLASAEQMEQTGIPGEIQVTENFYLRVKDQSHSYAFNERVLGNTKSYFVSEKLERSGSSGVFLNYIEANHQSLTFEKFEAMLLNTSGLQLFSDCRLSSDPIIESIMKTDYYNKVKNRVEAEVMKRSQARLSVKQFDENMLGYDVTKEELSEEMVTFGGKLFPRFKKKYERRFQIQTASARQVYTDLVTRCLLVVFVLWLIIDLARVREYQSGVFDNGNSLEMGRPFLIWISHALSLSITVAFWVYTRSRHFLNKRAEYYVPAFIFLIAIATAIRRYSYILTIYSHLRLEGLIFCGFSFYYYYVQSYYILITITSVYISMLTAVLSTATKNEIILYITTRYFIIMLGCFFASRSHNKNTRKEFLMTKLIKNEIEHKQKAINRSKLLLYNLFPSKVVSRLSISAQIADYYPNTTIAFINIAHFHDIEQNTPPNIVMEFLNDVFVTFDSLSYSCGVEKIKTINSKYMVASGIPNVREDHMQAAMTLVLKMFVAIKRVKTPHSSSPVTLRVGIASGPVVAGIIGKSKYSYDCWADAVNTAARMESMGQDGMIQVTEEVYCALRDKYNFQKREPINVKGKGVMTTYLLDPEQPLVPL